MKMRRVFITGGAKGIGRSMVRTFCQDNCHVAFCDDNEAAGQDTARAFGADFFHVDVKDLSSLEGAMREFVERYGDIDILINNVGISKFVPITDISVEDFDQIIATNLRPAFITSRFLAVHRQRANQKHYGRIINICSSRYKMSEAGTEGYSASKGGIYSLTHALAISLAPFGITVNAIAPGWIHVNEEEVLRPSDHSFHPSGRVGEPEDIARMAKFLCEEHNDFINGQTIVIDGGVTVKMIYPE